MIDIVVRYKKVDNNSVTPSRGSTSSAGLDLYAHLPTNMAGTYICIPPGETVLVSSGIAMEIPEGYFGAVYARSGLASKLGLRPANCVGVVDSDYRGTIMVALHNDSSVKRVVADGDRIAQMVIMPYLSVDLEEVEVLGDTGRGDGGFGSTGK